MSSFVTVRGRVIALESQTDAMLSQYSAYAQTANSEADSKEKVFVSNIEKALIDSKDFIEQLQRICDDSVNVSSSKLSQLQRHREILQQHEKTFHDIRSLIQQERSKKNLLFNVKRTLEENDTRCSGLCDEDEYINDESRRIENSHGVMDRLISHAFETRDGIVLQRMTLQHANDRMSQALQKIPGINHIISKINTRRKKNAFILSSLITVCIFFFFFVQ